VAVDTAGKVRRRRMPNNIAALRHQRGWSQLQLIVAIEQQAKTERASVARRSSLKTRLSKWENGHATPGEFYCGLLCSVFGVTRDELGFGPDEVSDVGPLELGTVPALTVTPDVVRFLEEVFAQYVRADRLLGPRTVLGVVREQCKMLAGLIASAREPIRSDLLRVGTRFYEFCGWLAQDTGDFAAAESLSARALDMTFEAGNTWFASYVFMRRSNIATDAGRYSDGLGLAQAALKAGAGQGTRLRALGLRQQANALALSGDERGAMTAIEQALESVAAPLDPQEAPAAYCTLPFVQMEGAACWTRLGRPDRAVTLLVSALDGWPDEDQRDRGIGVARLAIAHSLAGSVEEACSVGQEALAVVRAAPSARALTELERLRVRLAPWRRMPAVTELTDHIRSLATQ
jgi:transcriptional regulator with XRE-family HTH domain